MSAGYGGLGIGLALVRHLVEQDGRTVEAQSAGADRGVVFTVKLSLMAHGRTIKAGAITAYGRLEDRIRALSAGFQKHVAKPVGPAELAAVVASVAARSPKMCEAPTFDEGPNAAIVDAGPRP